MSPPPAASETPNSAFLDIERATTEPGSIDEIVEASRAAGWNERGDQLDAGRFVGALEVAQIGTTQIADVRYENRLIFQGEPPAGYLSLGIVYGITGTGTLSGRRIEAGSVLVVRSGEEYHHTIGGGIQLAMLSVPLDEISEQQLSRLPDLLTLSAAHLRSLVTTVHAGLSATRDLDGALAEAAAREALRDQVAALVPGVLRSGQPQSKGPDVTGWELARSMEDRSRTEQGQTDTLTALAAEAGVSERTVRRACHLTYGLGPHALGKALRLNEVRNLLLREDRRETTVSRAAGRSGFWHPGQFGRDYRRLFGERPSDTLARSRRRARKI